MFFAGEWLRSAHYDKFDEMPWPAKYMKTKDGKLKSLIALTFVTSFSNAKSSIVRLGLCNRVQSVGSTPSKSATFDAWSISLRHSGKSSQSLQSGTDRN